MQSPNFEVFGTAGEKNTRETLQHFEQVRDFFGQFVHDKAESAAVVRIVAFSSIKEFEPYRFNEVAIAYYKATAGRDYIVMSHAGTDTFPIAVHEYVHLLLRHQNLNFPPWLNEGMAELYSTLRPLGGKILVGDLVPGRFQALQVEKWVPLSIILAADQKSPYYNEKNKAGSLYNEGWALTHMLSLSPEYRPKFNQVMAAILSGMGSEEALTMVYGKPLTSIEKDLQAYLRGDRFKGAVFDTKLEKMAERLPAEAAPPFDVKLMLVDLSDSPGRELQNQKTLEDLTREEPQRPEPYVALAYLAWKQSQTSNARDDFGKAFALGSRDPRMLWDYGRMARGSDPANSVKAFTELLQQQPGRLDVRLELASVQLQSHAAKDAVQTLAPVKKVTPEDAPKLFTLVAYANLEAGDRAAALAAATQLKSVSKAKEDSDRADQLLQFIQRAQSAEVRPTLTFEDQPAVAAQDEQRPTLQRRDGPSESPQPPLSQPPTRARRPSLTGKFVELRCEAQATVVVETPEGKKYFRIDDPQKLLVNGKSGETRDLTCGPQKPVQIRIEFDPPSVNAQSGDNVKADGLVRGFYFDE